ncbi:hypothetical protein BXZ70DRAFT_719877 [Cristinia sonorae]|uniref:Uncharacterized protein n=1 Tax=Cristinia sonorae TaxID=1940300 RepID=A0A8K0USI2_9AGAR|nr:hypothetical protein BXZ70DRAFT_719877 [Cristinia sonorae]
MRRDEPITTYPDSDPLPRLTTPSLFPSIPTQQSPDPAHARPLTSHSGNTVYLAERHSPSTTASVSSWARGNHPLHSKSRFPRPSQLLPGGNIQVGIYTTPTNAALSRLIPDRTRVCAPNFVRWTESSPLGTSSSARNTCNRRMFMTSGLRPQRTCSTTSQVLSVNGQLTDVSYDTTASVLFRGGRIRNSLPPHQQAATCHPNEPKRMQASIRLFHTLQLGLAARLGHQITKYLARDHSCVTSPWYLYGLLTGTTQ